MGGSATRVRSALVLFGAMAAGAALAAPAAAQEDEWIAIRRVAVSASAPLAELNGGLSSANVARGTPLRLVVSGTVTDGIDGAELDAVARFASGVRDEIRPPLRLPAGARVTHADELAHRYEVDVAPGTDLRFALDVAGLAARHLVTASELRARLDGAIEIELLVPRSAVVPPVVPAGAGAAPLAPGSSLPGLALGSALGALGLALALRRRRARAEDELLLGRAVRAHAALGTKARALGPQFTGAIGPADRLLAAVHTGRGHLAAIDRALAESAFVESAAAVARRTELRQGRDAALARIAAATGALEEALVALGASTANRSAAADMERSLLDLGAEVEVGRAVDRELGLDATR